jgi:hypothetical protein
MLTVAKTIMLLVDMMYKDNIAITANESRRMCGVQHQHTVKTSDIIKQIVVDEGVEMNKTIV